MWSTYFYWACLPCLCRIPCTSWSSTRSNAPLKIENPEAWDQAKQRFTLSELEVAYRVLSASKDGFFQGNALSPAVMKARRIGVRWLYISMGVFMVVLFMGLATSLIEGKQ